MTPSLSSDSSSYQACKSSKDKRSEKNFSTYKSSVFLSGKGAWLLKELVKEVTQSSDLSTTNSDAEDRAPKLMVVHATDRHFQSVDCCKTYCLLDKSQIYN